jgi:transcriptional antiterminator NusG
MSIKERLRVQQAPGVIYLVGWRGYPEPLQDAEIEQLMASVKDGNDPRPHDFMTAGDRVVITRGSLKGREGFLMREKNKDRVVLSVDLIQRAMSIEVDADAIARA